MTLDEIKKIWIDDNAINVETKDGRVASEKISDYRRLFGATKEQRQNYKANNFGIHWPDIDEDLSFDGFFNKNENEISNLIRKHPIINVSALARRLEIPQPLFAAYVSGTKKPSLERINKIREEIKTIGRELAELAPNKR